MNTMQVRPCIQLLTYCYTKNAALVTSVRFYALSVQFSAIQCSREYSKFLIRASPYISTVDLGSYFMFPRALSSSYILEVIVNRICKQHLVSSINSTETAYFQSQQHNYVFPCVHPTHTFKRIFYHFIVVYFLFLLQIQWYLHVSETKEVGQQHATDVISGFMKNMHMEVPI